MNIDTYSAQVEFHGITSAEYEEREAYSEHAEFLARFNVSPEERLRQHFAAMREASIPRGLILYTSPVSLPPLWVAPILPAIIAPCETTVSEVSLIDWQALDDDEEPEAESMEGEGEDGAPSVPQAPLHSRLHDIADCLEPFGVSSVVMGDTLALSNGDKGYDLTLADNACPRAAMLAALPFLGLSAQASAIRHDWRSLYA